MATRETAYLTADVVLIAQGIAEGYVLLIRRPDDSSTYPGCWALPGGHLDVGERFADAARRELSEETGLDVARLRQVGVYDEPGRDPRGRYVSVAYTAELPGMATPKAGDDASAAQWWPLGSLPELAFDHARIVADALALPHIEQVK